LPVEKSGNGPRKAGPFPLSCNVFAFCSSDRG
jgi:hypothetical protein